ncbi:DNA topoisomerase (ATP-hydrolyzing) OS=Streptomyces tendae OX=1932 GN=GUR47_34830 PE=3 SV=1 [Streptomyces tendae]
MWAPPAANALSARLDIEVDLGGHTHAISFRRGFRRVRGAGPDAKFDAGSGLRKTKKIPKSRRETRVRYWADRQIFLRDAKLSLDTLHQRARQTAFLVPGLTIVVRDEFGLGDGGSKGEESFRFDGGISEFCEYLASDRPVCDTLRFSGQGSFKETVPVLDEDGQMTPTEVTRDLGVDVAMRWGHRLRHHGQVVRQHHRHAQGRHPRRLSSQQAVAKTMNEVLRTKKMLRVAEDGIVKDDALEGLTAVVTVRLAEPQFEGQTKEVLGTSAARRIVNNVITKELKAFLTSTKRDAAQQARVVMEKAVAAARTRIAARQHKDAQRRKTALESSSLPAKLADCRSDDVDRSELFIVEGDSALGTAKPPATPSSRRCCRSGARSSTSRSRPSPTC